MDHDLILEFLRDVPSILTFAGVIVVFMQSRKNGKVAKQNLAIITDTHAAVATVQKQTNGMVESIKADAIETGRQLERDKK